MIGHCAASRFIFLHIELIWNYWPLIYWWSCQYRQEFSVCKSGFNDLDGIMREYVNW